MKKISRKFKLNSILSLFLAFVMCVTIMPLTVVADDDPIPEDPPIEEELYESELPEYPTQEWRFDFSDAEAGRAGTGSVNKGTQGLTWQREELAISGFVSPVQIIRYFNTRNSSNLALFGADGENFYGTNWLLNYNQLIKWNVDENRYEYLNEKGQVLYYEPESGTEKDEVIHVYEAVQDDVQLTGTTLLIPAELEDYADLMAVRVENDKKQKMSFDALGRLVRVTETNEAASFVQINYLGESLTQIDKITDGVGREFRFTYGNVLLASIACYTADGEPIVVGGGDVMTHSKEDAPANKYDKLPLHKISSEISEQFGLTSNPFGENKLTAYSRLAKLDRATNTYAVLNADGSVSYFKFENDAEVTEESTTELSSAEDETTSEESASSEVSSSENNIAEESEITTEEPVSEDTSTSEKNTTEEAATTEEESTTEATTENSENEMFSAIYASEDGSNLFFAIVSEKTKAELAYILPGMDIYAGIVNEATGKADCFDSLGRYIGTISMTDGTLYVLVSYADDSLLKIQSVNELGKQVKSFFYEDDIFLGTVAMTTQTASDEIISLFGIEDFPYGENQLTKYNRFLKFDEENSQYILMMEDGSLKYFALPEYYDPEANYDINCYPEGEDYSSSTYLMLITTSTKSMLNGILPNSNIKYILRNDVTNEAQAFDDLGRLIGIFDMSTGKRYMRATYVGDSLTRLNTVQEYGQPGRKFVYENDIFVGFTQSPTVTEGAVSVDSAPLAMNYTYDSDGNLTDASYPDGESVSFAYADGYLIKATNIDGYSLNFTYGENGKVKKISKLYHDLASENDLPGESIQITFNDNGKPIFTSSFGDVEIIDSDELGRIFDSDTPVTEDIDNAVNDDGSVSMHYVGSVATSIFEINEFPYGANKLTAYNLMLKYDEANDRYRYLNAYGSVQNYVLSDGEGLTDGDVMYYPDGNADPNNLVSAVAILSDETLAALGINFPVTAAIVTFSDMKILCFDELGRLIAVATLESDADENGDTTNELTVQTTITYIGDSLVRIDSVIDDGELIVFKYNSKGKFLGIQQNDEEHEDDGDSEIPPTTEPVTGEITEHPTEEVTEPPSQEPITEPTGEPTSEPISEPKPGENEEHSTEPTTASVTEPTSEPEMPETTDEYDWDDDDYEDDEPEYVTVETHAVSSDILALFGIENSPYGDGVLCEYNRFLKFDEENEQAQFLDEYGNLHTFTLSENQGDPTGTLYLSDEQSNLVVSKLSGEMIVTAAEILPDGDVIAIVVDNNTGIAQCFDSFGRFVAICDTSDMSLQMTVTYDGDSLVKINTAKVIGKDHLIFSYDEDDNFIGARHYDETDWDDYWDDYNDQEYAELVEINEVNAWGQPILKGNSYNGLALVQSFEYTVDGNYATIISDESGIETHYAYNSDNGQKESDKLGSTTPVNYGYDASGALVAVTQAVAGLSNGTGFTNHYGYEKNRLVSISHNGILYEFTYDAFGNRLANKVDGNLMWEHNYSDAAKGEVGQLIYANGLTITYTYENDKVSTISYDNGETLAFEYTYDTDGELSVLTDNINNRITTYSENYFEIADSDGNIYYRRGATSENSMMEEFFGMVFTLSSESSQDEVTGNTTTTSTAELDGESRSFTRVDDIFGRTIQKQIRNGGDEVLINNDYSYRDISDTRTTRQVERQVVTTVGDYGEPVPLMDYEMEYDDRGNVSAIKLDGTVTFRYTYNDANMLIREDNAVDDKSNTFEYDVGGNMTTRTTYAFTLSDDLGQPINTRYFTYDGDRLIDTSDGEMSIEYDEIGNPLSYTGYAGYSMIDNSVLQAENTVSSGNLQWEGRNLVSSTGNGILFGQSVPGEMRYSYDADGLRTRKEVHIDAKDANLGDGSFLNWFFTGRDDYLDVTYEYIWDGKTFLGYDITLNGSMMGFELAHIVMRVVYSDAGESLGYMYAMMDTAGNVVLGDMVWYVKNILGDIQGLYSETYQSMEAAYTYDAWGTPTIQSLIQTDTDGGWDFSGLRILAYMLVNQLTYRGYYYDFETGLYYLQSRYYSPTWHRFINADKHFDTHTGMLGTNMYIYCNDNPITNTDPTGEAVKNAKLSKPSPSVEVDKTGVITLTVEGVESKKLRYTACLTNTKAKITNDNGEGKITVKGLEAGATKLEVKVKNGTNQTLTRKFTVTFKATTTASVNLRKKAKTSADVLTLIPSGKVLTIVKVGTGTSINGNKTWWKTTYDGKTGWLTSAYAKKGGSSSSSSGGGNTSSGNGNQTTNQTNYKVGDAISVSGGSFKSPFNTYPSGQCTWYAFGRMGAVNSVRLISTHSSGNHGGTWFARMTKAIKANIKSDGSYTKVSDVTVKRESNYLNVKPKSIAVYDSWYDDDWYGHVIFIEDVRIENGTTYVLYSEDNWTSGTNRKIKKMTLTELRDRLYSSRRPGSSSAFVGYLQVN